MTLDPMQIIKCLPARMLSKIRLPETCDSCWEWLGWKRGGYGLLKVGHTSRSAHWFTYEVAFGPIPAGTEIDHLCRNRSCVNPAHLEAVTHRENVLRGISMQFNWSKTHCVNGHEYAGENLLIIRGKNGRPERRCRECGRTASREHQRRKYGYAPRSH